MDTNDLEQHAKDVEENLNNKAIVDRNTGEIVDYLKEGDSIRRKETTEYLNSTVSLDNKKPFVKTFPEIRNFAKGIGATSLAISLVLQTYVSYTSNLVSYDNGKPIMNEDIMEIMGYSNPTITKCMNELVLNKVFARVTVGHYYQYYANPYIFCKGNRINKTLEDMFKSYKNKTLKK